MIFCLGSDRTVSQKVQCTNYLLKGNGVELSQMDCGLWPCVLGLSFDTKDCQACPRVGNCCWFTLIFLTVVYIPQRPPPHCITYTYTWSGYLFSWKSFPFENLFHGSYFLRMFLHLLQLCYYKRYVVKIFVLKYFRRTLTLRKIFSTRKFF